MADYPTLQHKGKVSAEGAKEKRRKNLKNIDPNKTKIIFPTLTVK